MMGHRHVTLTCVYSHILHTTLHDVVLLQKSALVPLDVGDYIIQWVEEIYAADSNIMKEYVLREIYICMYMGDVMLDRRQVEGVEDLFRRWG